MQISGKIAEIGETVSVKETFKKRDFVIEFAKNPKYPQMVQLQVVQDKCAVLDELRQGDEVSVEFDVEGRKWTNAKGEDKYFNTLKAWNVEKIGGNHAPEKLDNQKPADGDSDLPF
jgi:hypothetical protein